MSNEPKEGSVTAPQEPLKLTLGQRVRFNDLIFRDVESRPHPALSTRTERYKVWRRYATTYGGAKSGEGIVVGTRTLTDGHSPYVDDEVGFTYRPEKSHRAVVIATALRRKPVLAFLEDVEPVARDDAAELEAELSKWWSAYVEVAGFLGMVSTDDTGRVGAVAGMEEVLAELEQREKDAAELRAAVREWSKANRACSQWVSGTGTDDESPLRRLSRAERELHALAASEGES